MGITTVIENGLSGVDQTRRRVMTIVNSQQTAQIRDLESRGWTARIDPDGAVFTVGIHRDSWRYIPFPPVNANEVRLEGLEARFRPKTVPLGIASRRLFPTFTTATAYLAPEKRLSLELVRYKTHSYPDIGAPPEVINREIPVNYDIFIGIMWKRAGTPTATAPSGTIEEFNRACERRKQGSLPRIMFYVCDQPIPVPTAVEMQQLADVVKFRSQLASQGLTVSYPSHPEFGDHVRGDLLRAIRDILSETAASPLSATLMATSVDASSRERRCN